MAATGRKYDLYGDAFRADAYATFARVREEELRWRPVPLFRSLVALPVVWE